MSTPRNPDLAAENAELRARLAKAEETLKAIFEAAPIGLSIAEDPEGRHIRGNRANERMLGLARGEELSVRAPEPARFRPMRDGRDLPAEQLPMQRAVRGESVTGQIMDVLRPDGQTVTLECNAVPLLDDQGRPHGAVGVFLDITERKRTEAALRESEARQKVAEAVQIEQQRLQEVLNLLPAYVILLTPDYHVPFANRFFEERFGKAEGRRCYEYLFHRTEPCETCETYKVLKTKTSLGWEWTGPDGRNYDIHDFPFTDVDGSPLIMEVGLDITERKKAEAEVARHREHLQELVDERTAELRATNEELVRFNRAMVGRELHMIELKQEINDLCARLGQPPRYQPEVDHERARPPA